jgi:ribonuclease J
LSKIKIFSLGGLNENGKNMYVVDVDSNIFVFDAGLKFATDKMLGVDYILPDYNYIKKNKNKIKGIFLTHGHDSNMGAMADILYDMPDLPVYATKFTMEILKEDLQESNVVATNLKEIRPHSKIAFGDLYIFPISVTHSIPDSVCYVLYHIALRIGMIAPRFRRSLLTGYTAPRALSRKIFCLLDVRACPKPFPARTSVL